MEKIISGLKEHYIVCGMGRIGRHIIDELHKTRRLCVAIDKNEEACRRLAEEGRLFIRGDATSSAVLKSANITHAKGCSVHCRLTLKIFFLSLRQEALTLC